MEIFFISFKFAPQGNEFRPEVFQAREAEKSQSKII